MARSVKIVLDTCALIWWSLDPDKLSPRAQEACDLMEQEKHGLVPSTAVWEIAIKIKNNQKIYINPRLYFSPMVNFPNRLNP